MAPWAFAGSILLISCSSTPELQPSADPNVIQARRDIAEICTAIDHYAIEHEALLPWNLDLLLAPSQIGTTYFGDAWTEIPLDPWGNPYVYEPHPDGTYRVISYGEDGRPGGEGLSADIDNVTMRDGR
jgi:general secretion pathway protein G